MEFYLGGWYVCLLEVYKFAFFLVVIFGLMVHCAGVCVLVFSLFVCVFCLRGF